MTRATQIGKSSIRSLAAAFATALLAATVHAKSITHGTTTINMDFVTIGNPGNAPDDTGLGQVDYVYRIGKFEVTEDQWGAVVAADTRDLLISAAYSGQQPVRYINWYDAAMFSNWLTSGDVAQGVYEINTFSGEVRGIERDRAVNTYGTVYFIPTETEWYKAAYYDPDTGVYFDYPTGSDTAPTAEPPPGGENSANYNLVLNARTNVGAYVLSESPYGTFDQGGNVAEWIDKRRSTSHRCVRGGAYGWYTSATPLRADAQCYSQFPWQGEDFIGFRVASIPEPNTMSLLGMASLIILAPRRRLRNQACFRER